MELDIPDSAFEVLAFVALVVPGLIYAATRSRLRGYLDGDRSVASRIVQALGSRGHSCERRGRSDERLMRP
jgi:Family of unknown function (DUF6338)